MLEPSIVAWTEHALVKAGLLGIARADMERWVLDGHHARARNAGAGEWRVQVGRMVVVYNHPDRGDEHSARIVTVWRQR